MMAAEHPQDATAYIQHHLTFFAEPVREGGRFWTLHYDTIVTSGGAAISYSASLSRLDVAQRITMR